MPVYRHLLAAALCLAACGGADVPRAARSDAALPEDTAWVRRSVIYEVFVRSFSPAGTLRGVLEGLDRIQATGADVVWLMPIYPVGTVNRKEPLGSPYSLSDYRAINPAFGTADDFRALVDAVHARGMKLILDWVPNHTSWDHIWVREHPAYYVRDAKGGLTVPRNEKGEPTNWTDVAQLDYANPELRRAMIDAMRWWLTEFGIDGFRVDIAGFVPDDFWREAVPAVRAAVPRRILMLAEWGDQDMHTFGFDLTYAWDSYHRLKAVWTGAAADSLVHAEVADVAAMPSGGMRLRFTTNHDETAWDKPPVLLFGGPAGARAAFVAAALMPGRSLLYNGQEVESPQTLRLFYQDSIAWNQPGADSARAFYWRVVRLARTDAAFVTGSFRHLETSAPRDVIAYLRADVAVLVNARPAPVQLRIRGFDPTGARDLLTGAAHAGSTVTLPAYGVLILRRE